MRSANGKKDGESGIAYIRNQFGQYLSQKLCSQFVPSLVEEGSGGIGGIGGGDEGNDNQTKITLYDKLLPCTFSTRILSHCTHWYDVHE